MNFQSLINDICCDVRIKDGTINLENADHVFVLQEYLENAGYNINEIVEKTAKLFEAGRFPERQAYNKDGILVTFPTKEYRDKAVNKGTHFAENPKKQSGVLYDPDNSDDDLSLADVESEFEDEETTDKDDTDQEQDSVSLDQELDNDVTGNDADDNRTPKEKKQDAAAVDYILTNDPLQMYTTEASKNTYTIDEAVKLGYNKIGLSWYNNGKLIGEQFYDDISGCVKIKLKEFYVPPSVLNEAPGCNAQKMETFIDQEINGINSKDQVAKTISSNLKSKDKISKSQELGNKQCPISNVYFAQLNKTSKTDLVFNNNKRVSLKYELAQLCSAQNLEMNSVISAVLRESGEEEQVLNQLSSFIMDGLKKDFYIGLASDIKNKLHKSLTTTIKSNDESQLANAISDVESIINQNKKFLQDGNLPIDANLVLNKINQVFTQPKLKHKLIDELATGKLRFKQGDADFSAICIADYMMTWNCNGNYKMYTVDKFIDQNQNNISFRFSNRGGVRGISIRGDIKTKLSEQHLDEISLASIKDTISSILSTDVLELIKNLSTQAKEYFKKAWDKIKTLLNELLEYIARVGRVISAYIEEGYIRAMEFLGLQSEGIGTWRWESPDPINENISENIDNEYNELKKQSANVASILETPPLLKLNFIGIDSFEKLKEFVQNGGMNNYDFEEKSKLWFNKMINFLSKTKNEENIEDFMEWFNNAAGTSETLNKIGNGTASDFIHGNILQYYDLINSKLNVDDNSKQNTSDIVLIFGGSEEELLNNLNNISSEQDLKINQKSGLITFKNDPSLSFAQVSLKAGLARLGKITKKFFSYLDSNSEDEKSLNEGASDFITKVKNKILDVGSFFSKKTGDIYNWFLNKVNKLYENVISIFRRIPMGDIIKQDQKLENLTTDLITSSEEGMSDLSESKNDIPITNCNYDAMMQFYNYYKSIGFLELVKRYDSYESLSKSGGFVLNVGDIDKKHYDNISNGIEHVYKIFKSAAKYIGEGRSSCITSGKYITRDELSPALKLRANHIALRKIDELINSINKNSELPTIQTRDLPQIAAELSGEAIFGKNLSLPMFKFTGDSLTYYLNKQQYITDKQKQFSETINENISPGYISIYPTKRENALHFQVYMYLLFDINVEKGKNVVPMYSEITFTVGSGSKFVFNIEMKKILPIDEVKKQINR